MDSIVNKLTEIEDAASAVVQHAEDQKSQLEKEYEEKRRTFDEELKKLRQDWRVSARNLTKTRPISLKDRTAPASRRSLLSGKNTKRSIRNMLMKFSGVSPRCSL